MIRNRKQSKSHSVDDSAIYPTHESSTKSLIFNFREERIGMHIFVVIKVVISLSVFNIHCMRSKERQDAMTLCV